MQFGEQYNSAAGNESNVLTAGQDSLPSAGFPTQI